MLRRRVVPRRENARGHARLGRDELHPLELRRGQERGRSPRRALNGRGDLRRFAVERDCRAGAFRESRAQSLAELFDAAADGNVESFGESNVVRGRNFSNARRLGGQLREDALVNLARLPRGVKPRARLEAVAEMLERRGAAARARLALDETDADAARREQRGDGQAADASADDYDIARHVTARSAEGSGARGRLRRARETFRARAARSRG